jgi:hypothetical protein
MPCSARRLRRVAALLLCLVPLRAAPRLMAQATGRTTRPPARPAAPADVVVRTTASRPVAVVPLRRLVGRYTIVRHNAAAVPALIYADSATSEVLVNGVLDVRRDGAFTLKYVVRVRSLLEDSVDEDATELAGRVTSTSAGIRLNVTTNTGETLEEPWVLVAESAAAGQNITVTFQDGNLEVVRFRRR